MYKVIAICLLVALIVVASFGFFEVRYLNKAHSTFENYYTFRGCKELLERTPTSGVCKTSSGGTITIVLYKGKWYLKGDLPTGFLGHLL
jgi:hypothetical protein